MEFSDVVLNRSEFRILKRSAVKPVRIDLSSRLVRLSLIDPVRETRIPGGMPVPTGYGRISDRGVDYIAYRRDKFRERYAAPILVSIAVSLLTNGLLHGIPALLSWIQQWQSNSP